MQVTVLIDNNSGSGKLLSEHGLSLYFEVDGLKWLLDVGASGKFIENARHMGISIEEVDFLVLSHGHTDHTGGLGHFIQHNQKARIILSKRIPGTSLFSTRQGLKRDISMDLSWVDRYPNRFMLVGGTIQLSGNVALIADFPDHFTKPRANSRLIISDAGGERPDDFRHEMAIVVNSPQGLIVFSGCSHNGLLNILEAGTRFWSNPQVAACVGGTHLADGDLSHQYETDSEILEIGRSLGRKYPQMVLYTGHCTGSCALELLSEVMGERVKAFRSGDRLNISANPK